MGGKQPASTTADEIGAVEVPVKKAKCDIMALAAKHKRKSGNGEATVVVPGETPDALTKQIHGLLSTDAEMEGLKTNSDLCEFWRNSAARYPDMAVLARKILTIQATSTPSERVFSLVGLTVNSRRRRLDPTTVRDVVQLHENYQFLVDDLKKRFV